MFSFLFTPDPVNEPSEALLIIGSALVVTLPILSVYALAFFRLS